MTKSKNDRLLGHHLIMDTGGSPYMRRLWIGRLRLHIFYRGDNDPDPHDHPWDFWTFPLTPYVEEVTKIIRDTIADGQPAPAPRYYSTLEVVPAWRWTFRPAEHCHRVLGRWNGDGRGHRNAYPGFAAGKIVTIVWRGRPRRKWGFLKNRDGKWCWVAWKEYVFGGGKSAPCE